MNNASVLLILESVPWEGPQIENISHEDREINFSSRRGNWSEIKHKEIDAGVLSPTACLHLGDIMLFTVSTHHYPEYDL